MSLSRITGTGSLAARLAVLVLLGSFLDACTTWKTEPAAPQQVLTDKKVDRLRVTRADGSTLELVQPVIIGDTLSGSRPGSASPDSAGRIAIPLSDVRSVAVQRVSAGKTALLIGGLGLTAIAIVAATSSDPEPAPPPPPVSCPLVYSWDGATWRLDSGTFGGAIAPALARTDVDNLIYAVSQDNVLRLRLANELNETDYLDALSVLAIDHPPGTAIAPDSDGRIHTLGRLIPPATAHDFRERDAISRVSAADGWSWESNPTSRDTAVMRDIRDGLVLVFPNPGARRGRLVLDGNNTPWASHLMQKFVSAHGRATQAWYDSLEAYPELGRGLAAMLAREAYLGVSVWSEGRWKHQGYIREAGPEIVKRQVFLLDLSRVAGDSVRIRLESAPSFWLIDHVALDASTPAAFEIHEAFAASVLDRTGADVSRSLRSHDGQYLIMERGDEAEMAFRVPPIPQGRSRSYLVRSSGWYRIHGSEIALPDTTLLSRALSQRHGASRMAVAMFNEALLSLERAGP